MTGMWDTTQLRRLESDLGKVAGAVVPAVVKVTAVSGAELVALWKSNAAASGGVHMKDYPKDITGEAKASVGVIGFEAGPQNVSGRGHQGGLGRGEEYGTHNHPPHLNGNRAADVVGPKYAEALAAAAARVMGTL